MPPAMQVLLIDPSSHDLPDGIGDLLSESGWQVRVANDYRSALEEARSGRVDALVLAVSDGRHRRVRDASIGDLLRVANAGRMATVLLTDGEADELVGDTSLIDVVSPRADKRELRSRLATLRRCQSLVRRMEQELSSMERLGKRLNRHFTEVEQEMRLAGQS